MVLPLPKHIVRLKQWDVLALMLKTLKNRSMTNLPTYIRYDNSLAQWLNNLLTAMAALECVYMWAQPSSEASAACTYRNRTKLAFDAFRLVIT